MAPAVKQGWQRNIRGSLAGGRHESLRSSAYPTEGDTSSGDPVPPTPRVALPQRSHNCGETPLSAGASTTARSGSGSANTPTSEEHTSELQSHLNLVCRLLLVKNSETDDSRRTGHGARVPPFLS